jgi:tetratricopeptide (TPR) repeat protein
MSCRSREDREALASYNRVVDLDATRIEAWYNKGELHRKLGEDREALASYNRVVDLDATQIEAWYNKESCIGSWERTVKRWPRITGS